MKASGNLLAVVLGLLLLSGGAQACSYDGLALDLALAHPASLEVSLALHQAYQDKLLAKPVPLPGGFGMRRTLHLLEQMRTRLAVSGAGFSLLLIEPGLWVRFTPQGVTVHATPPAPGEAVAVTGEGVLLAMQGGKLDAEQAMRDGLLYLEGNLREPLAATWRTGYPAQAVANGR